MATVDNFFSAVPDQNRLMAFANKSEGHGQLPLYRFGVVGYGSAGGMVGCGGGALKTVVWPFSPLFGGPRAARGFTRVARPPLHPARGFGSLPDDHFLFPRSPPRR